MTLVPDLIFNDQDHPHEIRHQWAVPSVYRPEALLRADNLICFLRLRLPFARRSSTFKVQAEYSSEEVAPFHCHLRFANQKKFLNKNRNKNNKKMENLDSRKNFYFRKV